MSPRCKYDMKEHSISNEFAKMAMTYQEYCWKIVNDKYIVSKWEILKINDD